MVVELRDKMTLAAQTSDRRIEPLPDDIDSPRAKLVYLSLQVSEGGSVADLQRTLDVPKLTLLSVLDTLAGRGLVEREGDRFVPAA